MSEEAQRYFARYTYHLAVAAEIEKSLPHYRDWACVARFYAALDLMNAYLTDRGHVHFNPVSTDHKERKQAMARCPELRDAPERYRRLKDMSEDVRYKAGFVFTDQHDAASKSLLAKIIAIVEPKLKKA